jgi:DNA-binding protein YbaB
MESIQSYETSQKVARATAATLQDLSNTLVEGSAADGKVKVTFNGQQEPINVQIDEGYYNKVGVNELSSALIQAMKDANIKSALKVDDKLKSLYNDFGFDSS